MGLEHFILTYGYLAIFAGTFLEGEAVLILGGFIAHRGYLPLYGVIASAFLGSMTGDQLYFFIGRKWGGALLERFPSLKRRVGHAGVLCERYRGYIVVGFRFIYGMRTITPFVLGICGISPVRFFVLNLTGAVLWAVTFGLGGYFLGHALSIILGDIRRYEITVGILILSAGALLWAIHQIKRFFSSRRGL